MDNQSKLVVSQNQPCKGVKYGQYWNNWFINFGFVDAKQIHLFMMNRSVVSFPKTALEDVNGTNPVEFYEVNFTQLFVVGKPPKEGNISIYYIMLSFNDSTIRHY